MILTSKDNIEHYFLLFKLMRVPKFRWKLRSAKMGTESSDAMAKGANWKQHNMCQHVGLNRESPNEFLVPTREAERSISTSKCEA